MRAADSDNDGVSDDADRCPGEVGNAEDGCMHAELDLGLDPQAMSVCPLKGDPISIYSGNHMESEEDVRLASPFAKGLVFKRFYNSRSEAITALGYSWTHTYGLTLQKNPSQVADHEIMISDEIGFGRYFSQFNESPVRIEARFGERSRLSLEAGSYIWRRTDGSAAAFDAASLRLSWLEDESGNHQEIAWNTGVNPARIETVTDLASGRVLRFGYTGERLSAIHLYTGGVDRGAWVTYGHDANGNLTAVTYADGSGFRYQYNDTDNNPSAAPFINNMTLKKNAANHELARWRYDEQDRCWFNESREDRGVGIDYDTYPGKVIATDVYGKSRTYTLTLVKGRKRISEVTGDAGCASCSDEVTRAAYDADLNVTEKEYANGLIIRYADFDARGNPGTVTYAAGSPAERVVRFTYHPSMDVPLTRSEKSLLSAQDSVTLWDYDDDGNEVANENPTQLVRRIAQRGYTRNVSGGVNPIESVTRLSYNARGQLVSIAGPRAGSTDNISLTYDPATGDLLTVTRPLAGTTGFADYSPSGQAQQMTDANGNRFSYTYDGRGRIKTLVSQADGSTATFDYNAAGEPSRVTAANGVATDFEYDAAYGRLIRVLDPLGNHVASSYDAQGNRIEESIYNPSAQRAFRKRFDYQSPQSPGKLWKEINPDNSFTAYSYDAVGNIQAVTDPAGKTTAYSYDSLKRLIAVTQPGAVRTDYAYDRIGNLASVTDAEGRRTVYAHDDLGRLLKTDSPDTRITTYAYDSAGNLVSKTDANGITTTYAYDALNRLTAILYPDPAQNITYTYDEGANGKGRLTAMSDPSGATTYAYDAKGNLIRESRTIRGVVYQTSYSYDAAGVLTSMTYPDGRSVTYSINSAGRVSRVSTTKGGATRVLADSISYLPFGPVSGFTYGNGLNLVQDFDALYRPEQISAANLYNVGFARDPAGNITAIADNLDAGKSQTFGYDALYRLTSATGIYGTISYTYDKIGNHLTETTNDQTDTYTYAAGTSRLVQIAGTNPRSFALDSNGNTTATGSKSFSYNQNNRLIRAAEEGRLLAAYTYNGSGQRVIKETENETIVYHYDRFDNLIAESSLSGEFRTAYVYLNGTRLAEITKEAAAELAIGVATSKGQPLSGLRVYAFTEAGRYTGISAATDENGKAIFELKAFAAGSYKFRADYLTSQFWSDVVALPGLTEAAIRIAEETATLQVAQGGAPAAGVKVYLFNAGGSYLGLYKATDANGQVSFELPSEQQYKFRADVLGSQFFSETVTVMAGGANSFSVATGGGVLTVALGYGEGAPLPGVPLYLFSEQGAYLGLSGKTDAQGRAGFPVPAGRYKVRADYLGYQFWTGVIPVSAGLTASLAIPHREVVISVNGELSGDVVSREGLKVYLFMPSGAYMGRSETTDANGQARFKLPAREYKVLVDYLGRQFWSDVFVQADQTVEIPEGEARLTVTCLNHPLGNIPVYVFSPAGAYLGLHAATGASGEALFRLPAGEYNFRADYLGSQYFSGTTTLIADELNLVSVSAGGGNFTLTVQEAPGEPMAGVACYLFAANGAYLGRRSVTNDQGQAAFELADGNYRIRVDYLGYPFLTPAFAIPAAAALSFAIPHEDTVITVKRDYNGDVEPGENFPVYLFTAAGAYLGRHETADENGEAIFSLPAGDYKVRADFLSAQYWSEIFNQTDQTITIPEGEVQVTVTQGKTPLANVPIYVFTASDSYLNISARTDAEGGLSFILPEGAYKFRADYQGEQFWATQAVAAHQLTTVSLNTGGGTFVLTVEKAPGNPLAGVPVYVFSSSGTYLGLTRQTDAQGQVSFDLSNGSYKFRADYRGYPFWSNAVGVPGTLADVLAITHQDVTVTVNEVYQSSETPLAYIKVYLFTAVGAYQGINAATNSQGKVTFNLPQKDYKVRADYLSGQYWSQVFTAQEIAIDIPHGYAKVQVSEPGAAVYNAPVYLFTATGSYLSRMFRTDGDGLARFRIPAGSYKFRVDYNGRQYWSDAVNILTNEETAVALALDLLALNLTNDPDPVRLDGIPPKLEQKPSLEPSRVLLASLSDISGILASSVVAQIPTEDKIYYYINDHLGTPQKIIDQNNNVVWMGDYRPFGTVNAAVANIGNGFRFPGQYWDQETGLHYNLNRYYDPTTGRYLTPDPIGLAGGINLGN